MYMVIIALDAWMMVMVMAMVMVLVMVMVTVMVMVFFTIRVIMCPVIMCAVIIALGGLEHRMSRVSPSLRLGHTNTYTQTCMSIHTQTCVHKHKHVLYLQTL